MLSQEIRNIGIFRALYLGDMLCIIPTVRAIRFAYPQAHITLVGLAWQKEFAQRFSHYFDEFLAFPGWPGLPEQKVEEEAIVAFLDKVRGKRFDLLMQMQGNGEQTNKMCLLWNARVVSGLRRSGEFAPESTLFPVSEDNEHEVLRFMKLLVGLNIEPMGTDLEFPITSPEIAEFDEHASKLEIQSGKYICLHPGARDPRRRWPAKNFAAVADYFSGRGYRVVLTGSTEEIELLREVQQQVSSPVINSVNILGNLPLGGLACIITNSLLLISNDTGVSHIAAGLKKRSVIIFSEFSNIGRWAPLDKDLHRSVPSFLAQPSYIIQTAEEQLTKVGQELRLPS